MLRKHKFLASTIMLVITAVFVYFLFRDPERDSSTQETEDSRGSGLPTQVHINSSRRMIKTELPITHNSNKNLSQEKKPTNREYSLQLDISYYENCSYAPLVPDISSMDTKSQRQLDAFSKLQRDCETWQFSADPDAHLEYKRELEKIDKLLGASLEGYYIDRPAKKLDIEVLEAFRNQLDSPSKAVSVRALLGTLMHDRVFRQKLLATIGSSDHRKVQRHAMDIAMLRGCTRFGACGANDPFMLSLCYVQERACGLSFYDWVASRVSANEFNDLILLADNVDVVLEESLEPIGP